MHDRPRSTSDSGAVGGISGGRRSSRTGGRESGGGGSGGGGGNASGDGGIGPSPAAATALRTPLLRLFDSEFVERLREAIPEHHGGGGAGAPDGAAAAAAAVPRGVFFVGGGGDDGGQPHEQPQHADIEAPPLLPAAVEAGAILPPTVFDATCAAAAAAAGEGGADAATAGNANDTNAAAVEDDDAPVADEDVPKFGELIRQQPGDVIAYLENDALVSVAEFDADDALVLRALAGRPFLVVGRDHFDDDYEPMWLERLARIAGGREAARAAARAAAEEAEAQQLHRRTAALYGPLARPAAAAARLVEPRATGGTTTDLEERGSTAGGTAGGSAHGGSLFNGFGGGDLTAPLLGGGGGNSSPAVGGPAPQQQQQQPPRSGNGGGGTGPSPLGGGPSTPAAGAVRDVAGSLAAAAPRESAALAAAMARRAAAAAAKAAEKQQQQPSAGAGGKAAQQQKDEQQQKQQNQKQQRRSDPQQQQQQHDQQQQQQPAPPPSSPPPPQQQQQQQQQQQGRLNPSLGWTSTVQLEAYVVNVRDAAAEGHRGLLRPLLQRHKARGCPLAVFSLPAVQAVIEWKWQTWARRALRAELACYVAWIAAFTLFTLLFQREDADASLAELLSPISSSSSSSSGFWARWTGPLTVLASLWSAAASLPFVYMEACTIRAYGLGGWVSLINVMDALTYALQFAITFLHLVRVGLSTSWFNILVAGQTLGLWFKLQYYGRAFDPTRGVSMEAVQRVVHELRWFFLLFGAVLLGFGLSFFALYRNDRETVAAFSSLPKSLAMMASFTLMMFDYNDFYGSSVPVASMLLFCFFSFVVCIMLFNLLIALMTSSFQRISADTGGLRLALSRAEMVDELETTLPAWARAPPPRFLHVLRVHPEAQYSVDLSSVWSGIGSLERTLLGAERETAARVEALERSAAALDRKLDVLLRFQLAGVLGERQAAAAALAAAFGAGGGGARGGGVGPLLERAASMPLGGAGGGGGGSVGHSPGGSDVFSRPHIQRHQQQEEEEEEDGSGGGAG